MLIFKMENKNDYVWDITFHIFYKTKDIWKEIRYSGRYWEKSKFSDKKLVVLKKESINKASWVVKRYEMSI